MSFEAKAISLTFSIDFAIKRSSCGIYNNSKRKTSNDFNFQPALDKTYLHIFASASFLIPVLGYNFVLNCMFVHEKQSLNHWMFFFKLIEDIHGSHKITLNTFKTGLMGSQQSERAGEGAQVCFCTL